MQYQFLENMAIADSAFEVTGDNPAEIFAGAGLATMATMVNLETVSALDSREVRLTGSDVSKLLFDFLNELIFIKDTEKMLFSKFSVKLTDDDLKVVGFGEKIDREKHELLCDVKAVTMYKFKVWEEKGKWKARVVLDV